MPVGTDIIETSSNDGELLVLAGKNSSTGHFMVQIINTGAGKSVNISGLSNNNFSLMRTSASEKMQAIGNYSASNGNLTLSLPAESISTLSGNINLDGGDTTPPAAPSGLSIN